MKVLIVDDAYFVRLKLKSVLSVLDIEIIEAENGEQAWSLYKEHKPDFIFLDVVMPKKDGLTFFWA